MKTYWLEGRESRPSLTKVISPQLTPGTELEWERAADVRDSIAEHSAQQMNIKEAQNSARIQNSENHLPNTVNSGPNSLVNSSGNLMAVQNTVAVRSSQISNTPTTTMMSPGEERRMYSPVTFQDVARRSIANSPNRTERERGKIHITWYQFYFLPCFVLLLSKASLNSFHFSRLNLSSWSRHLLRDLPQPHLTI